jgi:hypothetical protein
MELYLYPTNSCSFYESRLIYFAKDEDGEGGYESDSKDTEKKEASETVETEAEKAESPEVTGEVKDIQDLTKGRYKQLDMFIDKYEYEKPPDVDPDRLKNARENVDKLKNDLEQDHEKIDSSINIFIKRFKIEGDDKKEMISQILYKHLPEYNGEDLINKEYEHAPRIDQAALVGELYKDLFIDTGSDEMRKSNKIRQFAEVNFIPKLQEIARKEWEMLKTVYTVKEFMWDVHDKLKPKILEQRMKKELSRYTGIQIKKGQRLAGDWIKEVSTGKDTYSVKEYNKKWKIRDVYINKTDEPEYEIDKYSDEKMYFNGLWVDVEEEDTGRWERMPVLRFKEFIERNDIVPIVKTKKELFESVPYLNQIGVDIQPGMEFEYDEMTRDESGNTVSEAKKVKVVSISDSKVKLDREVIVRSKYDSPDLAHHESKYEMTMGEFAKWLNRRRPLPVMSENDLQIKLKEHNKQMINEYGLYKDCHKPIDLKDGEIIYADAPGNPLYKIEEITPENGGTVVLKLAGQEKSFTFPEFLRWVYDHGIEKYDPELQAKRAKKYLGADKKDLPKIRERAKEAIKNFQESGAWREDLEKLAEKSKKEGKGDIHIPKGDDLIGINKQIDATTPSRSALREFIKDTEFLSLDDIFQLFKSGWEYYSSNWKKKQQYRYSSIGKNIPWFSTEFNRINQSAESEYVNKFKEAMDQWSVLQVEETLYQTKNKDQAKACLITLAEKGMIRWDDPRLWAALNKFSSPERKIPIPKSGEDPYHPYKKGAGKFLGEDVEGKTGMDLISEVIDSIWGEQTYISWRRQNDGAIEDGIQKSYNKGMELENDPKNTGGISEELSLLLAKHMNDQYVDPQEFEGLLRFIIENGKGSAEDKIYYLLMGTTAENSRGRTLMGWERIGTFISKLDNHFPVLDYFTDKKLKRDPKDPKKLVERPWIRSDFDELTKEWKRTARADKYKPTAKVTEYLWREGLTSQAFQERLEKAIRNAENIDHDDTQMFIPALKEDEAENVTSNTGGNKRKFTIQGYKNAYVGFGTRLKYLMKKLNYERELKGKGYPGFEKPYIQRITDAIRTFVRYDSILDYRYQVNQGNRVQRFSDADFRTPCVVDSLNPVSMHQKEMQNLVKQILEKYNVADNDEFKYIFERPSKIPKNMRKKVENDIKLFGRRFYDLVTSDDAKGLLEVINQSMEKNEITGLEGGPSSPAEKAQAKIKMELMQEERSLAEDSA